MTSAFVISPDGKFYEEKDVIEKLGGEDGDCMNLKVLQKAVGGYIAPVLCNRDDGRFNAFVNDEGALERLPPNELATRVLEYLDFCIESLYDGVVWGNAIMTGPDEAGLDADTIAALGVLCKWFSAHGAETEPPLTEGEMCLLFKNGSRRPKRPAERDLESEFESETESGSKAEPALALERDDRDIPAKDANGADANPADCDRTEETAESDVRAVKVPRLEEPSTNSS